MKQAFSLVELSIVLVILGLLTGGILGGQSLIRAAELRAVSTEYARYLTAANSFRDKYFQLPGDMNNAQSFWTAAAACPGTTSTPSITAATCNGNGDGIIVSATNSHEAFRFWQHLANAGMIEGTYDGVSGNNANDFTVTATNSPRSKVPSSAWFMYNWGTHTGDDSDRFALVYNNFMMVGGYNGSGAINVGRLKPEEVWNIDTKMDDGKPAQGKVLTRNLTACTDTTSSLTLTANYRLTSTSTDCIVIFRQVF
jgi:prepilin-type N-terminal cleavage/methylation domain-containing protein